MVRTLLSVGVCVALAGPAGAVEPAPDPPMDRSARIPLISERHGCLDLLGFMFPVRATTSCCAAITASRCSAMQPIAAS